MVRCTLPCLAVLSLLLAPAAPVRGQGTDQSSDLPPAHVARVEGTAALERDGGSDTSPLNMPLLAGDRLRTEDGRVEVQFADGSAVFLDRDTTIDLQSDDLLRLMDGRIRLAIAAGGGVAYRVDSPAGSVRIDEPGDYRVALLRGDNEIQVELAVVRGRAAVFTDAGETPVQAGERAYASADLLPSYTYAFNSAQGDDFDRWVEGARDARRGASAQYLPADVQSYASTFDEYGDWRYQAPYGYVWYPRVASAWRPYYYGRWTSYPGYGWTWVGTDAFAWPTHHYGRWGFSAGVWFWIPASRWAPAWVSWASAPGYVSWCPLGFDNRPVFSIGVRVGGGYSPWRAWTVVSASHFGRGYVPGRVFRTSAWERGPHPSFRVRPAGPAYNVAVPRGSTFAARQPIRSTGRAFSRTHATADAGNPLAAAAARARADASRDGARSTAVPRYVNRGNDIIRSRTARPVPPAATVDVTREAPARAGRATAVPRDRTAPAASARAPRPAMTPSTPARVRPNDSPAYRPDYAPDYRPNYTPDYRPNYAPGYRSGPGHRPGAAPDYRRNDAPASRPNAAPGYRGAPGAQPRSTPPASRGGGPSGYRPQRAPAAPSMRAPAPAPQPSLAKPRAGGAAQPRPQAHPRGGGRPRGGYN